MRLRINISNRAADIILICMFAALIPFFCATSSASMPLKQAQYTVLSNFMNRDNQVASYRKGAWTASTEFTVKNTEKQAAKSWLESENGFSKLDDGLHIDGDYARATLNVYDYRYMNYGKSTHYVCAFSSRLSSQQERQYQEACLLDLVKLDLRKDNTYTKVKKIYGYITKTVYYDYSEGKYAHTGYAAAVKHKAVCYGYAQMMYTMCRDCGIPCRIIIGKVGTGYHAWNIVKVGRYWYYCDPTWDAQEKEKKFFLRGNDCIEIQQRVPEKEFRTAEFQRDFPVGKTTKKPDAN